MSEQSDLLELMKTDSTFDSLLKELYLVVLSAETHFETRIVELRLAHSEVPDSLKLGLDKLYHLENYIFITRRIQAEGSRNHSEMVETFRNLRDLFRSIRLYGIVVRSKLTFPNLNTILDDNQVTPRDNPSRFKYLIEHYGNQFTTRNVKSEFNLTKRGANFFLETALKDGIIIRIYTGLYEFTPAAIEQLLSGEPYTIYTSQIFNRNNHRKVHGDALYTIARSKYRYGVTFDQVAELWKNVYPNTMTQFSLQALMKRWKRHGYIENVNGRGRRRKQDFVYGWLTPKTTAV